LLHLQEKAERGQQGKPQQQEDKKNVAAEFAERSHHRRRKSEKGLCLHKMPESRKSD